MSGGFFRPPVHGHHVRRKSRPGAGGIVDGCPPGLSLAEDDLPARVDRRRPGTSRFTSQRREADRVRILSGVFEGRTTGTPIGVVVENEDQRSYDYERIRDRFRPGHAITLPAEIWERRPSRGRALFRPRDGDPCGGRGYRAQIPEGAAGNHDPRWLHRLGSLRFAVADLDAWTPTHSSSRPVAGRGDRGLITRLRREGIRSARVSRSTHAGVPPGLGEPVFGRSMPTSPRRCGINAGQGCRDRRLDSAWVEHAALSIGTSSRRTASCPKPRGVHAWRNQLRQDVIVSLALKPTSASCCLVAPRRRRAGGRDLDDGPARPLCGAAGRTDRRGDACPRPDGPLSKAQGPECRRPLTHPRHHPRSLTAESVHRVRTGGAGTRYICRPAPSTGGRGCSCRL